MAKVKFTAAFSEKTTKRIKSLAADWDVSEGEVVRRLVKLGDFVVKETERGAKIYSKDGKEEIRLEIV